MDETFTKATKPRAYVPVDPEIKEWFLSSHELMYKRHKMGIAETLRFGKRSAPEIFSHLHQDPAQAQGDPCIAWTALFHAAAVVLVPVSPPVITMIFNVHLRELGCERRMSERKRECPRQRTHKQKLTQFGTFARISHGQWRNMVYTLREL